MQTILGAGGDIGTLLAKELKNYTNKVRLVARNPKRVNPDDELFPADLTNALQVAEAVKGSTVAYLTVGLVYDHKIWKKQWPVIMQNVIEACLLQNTKLVFFDNVYMYGKEALPDMTEGSVINPPSKKGAVRARVAAMLAQAGENRGLRYVIARSADFYGPSSANGILNMLVLDPLKKGSKPQWQTDPDKIHSFTYTPDAARATALLGNTPAADGQVWHLPTSDEKLTGRELIALACEVTGRKPDVFVLAPWMMKIGGLFSGKIGELYEMQYQNDRDYFFNSSRFNKTFGFTPTPYATGIRETLKS